MGMLFSWRCKEKNKDGFVKFSNMKVPDTNTSWINRSMTLEECKEKCWENCSCTAYGSSDILGKGNGCILWFGDLLDLRLLPDAGQDLYVRVHITEIMGMGFYFVLCSFLVFFHNNQIKNFTDFFIAMISKLEYFMH